MAGVRRAVSMDARFIQDVLDIDSSWTTRLSVAKLRAVYEAYESDCSSKERSLDSWSHVKDLLKSMCGLVPA